MTTRRTTAKTKATATARKQIPCGDDNKKSNNKENKGDCVPSLGF